MSHKVEIITPEPIYDTEGLRVTGVPKAHRLTCICGWEAEADTPDEALEMAYKHGQPPPYYE